MIYIAPSVLAADFSQLTNEIMRVQRAGANMLHLDVMDGHFVPNISFGAPVIASLRKRTSLLFDVHLMITDPQRYIDDFLKAGADSITIHAESCEDPLSVRSYLEDCNCRAAIAISPNTPAETVSLKNDGMTKETKPGASNPIVLEAFDDVWENHVEKMSRFHAFVIPIDNINKIINYGTWTDGETQSVSKMLSARYSNAVNEYLTNFIQDLNGAKGVNTMGWITGLMSKFKKTAVAASFSVAVQQPMSVIRSFSEIDPKYFKPHKPTSIKDKWELIKQYAPIALVKEVGGFDAGSGRTIKDWLSEDRIRGLDKVAKKIDDYTTYGAELGDMLGWSAIWDAVENEIAETKNVDKGTAEFYKKVGDRFTEIIVKTQVYDSTLSRSGFLRSKNDLVKMTTSFMGEPTLSVNMMANALLQAVRGKITKKQAVRTIAFVYLSIVAATAAKSVIYALRDDDEDESYAEKYVQAFSKSIVGDMIPLSMLPIFNDIWSILEGWEVERTDMGLIADLRESVMSLNSDSKSAFRKVEDFAGAVGALFGVPARNMLRSAREVYSIFENIADGVSGGDLGNAFREGITGKDIPKREAMYNALASGDKSRIEIYRRGYSDESEYVSAVKQSIRQYDPRVAKAIEGYLSGNYNIYNNTKKSVIASKKFDSKTVNDAFADEREYVLKKLDEARKARKNGNMKEYNEIIDKLVERGYSRPFIMKKLK
jgi:hypothetical protein